MPSNINLNKQSPLLLYHFKLFIVYSKKETEEDRSEIFQQIVTTGEKNLMGLKVLNGLSKIQASLGPSAT